ncbi:transcription factor MYB30 [Gossypium raimondii]|uniref:Uncharacterized protein n=1 Tax=Gossypium raimondii TaxID=29730 RepID=A0A0D2V605_GOSRA|nr:transcription factor MYB30 [Gossypium raimondii]KJB77339.1 hypothetical protein B456_012G132400 [Gossypium raimondii]MBA0601559.1 hypothetical protein [Gossypium raimondii]
MVRTPYCDKSGLRKGTWTPEEDRKLTAYVTRYGCWNWRQLPKYAGLARCGKSCRLRWLNYLRPNIKRGNYSKEEEETIIRLHESLGNRWSAIAAQLPGRTDNEIKNHWHTHLKKRFMDKQNNREKAVEKKEKKLNNHHHLVIDVPTSPPLILESSLSASPQPTSSDQYSTITKDNTVLSSKDSVTYDHNNNNKASLEGYEANSGNFWNEPFFWDSCNINTSVTLDPASYELPEFPFLDGEISCHFDSYDPLDGFYF